MRAFINGPFFLIKQTWKQFMIFTGQFGDLNVSFGGYSQFSNGLNMDIFSTRGKYGEGDAREKFRYATTLVFIQCIINSVFAKCCKYQHSQSDGHFHSLLCISCFVAIVLEPAAHLDGICILIL